MSYLDVKKVLRGVAEEEMEWEVERIWRDASFIDM
jgi:hypothetical protein